MGWDSCVLRQKLNVIRLSCRLIKMPAERLTKRIFLWDYELSLNGHRNWSSYVKTLLQATNNTHLYENIFLPLDTDSLLKSCRKNLQSSEAENWQIDLQKYPKLRTYKCFKSTFGTENYVKSHISRDQRSILAQFRAGVLPLKVETGQFTAPYTHLENRICEVCHQEVEDEKHFYHFFIED